MDLSQAGQSFSGAPQPPPPLSGLQFGGMGFSGAGSGGDQGGSILGGSRGPGMEAGPGLDILSLLLGQGGSDLGGSSIPNISLGQQLGGFGAGLLGQQGGFGGFPGMGQQSIAGQVGGAGQGGQGTSGDLLGILKSLLGLGKAGAGLFDAFQSPGATRGDTVGVSLSDQTRGGYSPTQVGVASPTVAGLPGTDPFPGMPPDILQALGAGTGYRPDILSPETQGALGSQIFGPDSGYQTPGVGGGGGGWGPESGPASGGVTGSDIGAGAGGLLGLLNLFQGVQGGNPTQATGGGLQAVGGAGKLLGIPGIGDVTGALGGGLNLAQGIQRGNESQIAGGGVGAISSLLSLFGEGALGSASSVLGPLGLVLSLALPGNINDQMKAQDKLRANLSEIQGIQKDFGTAFPTVQQGFGLPQEFQAAQQSGDPQRILYELNKAYNILAQGPAISRAESTPSAGPYQSGIPSDLGLWPAFGNAANTYMQALTELQRTGALTGTPTPGGGTQNAEGVIPEAGTSWSVGGSSLGFPAPAPPSSLTGYRGVDPQAAQQYTQMYQTLFPGWQPPQAENTGWQTPWEQYVGGY